MPFYEAFMNEERKVTKEEKIYKMINYT